MYNELTERESNESHFPPSTAASTGVGVSGGYALTTNEGFANLSNFLFISIATSDSKVKSTECFLDLHKLNMTYLSELSFLSMLMNKQYPTPIVVAHFKSGPKQTPLSATCYFFQG